MEPQRRRKLLPKLIKRDRFEIPVRLVLEFDRPVSLAESQQLARRLLDHLEVRVSELEHPDGFHEARLSCASLRRTIRLASSEMAKPLPGGGTGACGEES